MVEQRLGNRYDWQMIYLLVFAVVVVLVLAGLAWMLMQTVKDLMADVRAMAEVKPDEINAMGDMMAKVFYPPSTGTADEGSDDEDDEFSYPQHEADDDMEQWIKDQLSDVTITDFVENYHPGHEGDGFMLNDNGETDGEPER